VVEVRNDVFGEVRRKVMDVANFSSGGQLGEVLIPDPAD
jgi:hypothetical protein